MPAAKKVKDTKYSIHEQYFDLTKEYTEKYGERTIVFIECGIFFEIYAMKDTNTGDYIQSQILNISHLAGLTIGDAKKQYNNMPVMMAGIQSNTIEKYLEKILSGGYTVVMYVQNKDDVSRPREFHSICSPGTYVSYETESVNQLSNNICCIWLEKYKDFKTRTEKIVCGMATCHMFSGETTIFEYSTDFIMNPTTFDELERYLCTNSPSEILIVSGFKPDETKKILQYSGLKTKSIHYYYLENPIVIIENCQKQVFMQEIISKFFGAEAYSICGEFRENTTGTQAFCLLMNFIQEHNPTLTNRINVPKLQNMSSRMYLANSTLLQLNILEDGSKDSNESGQHSSVSSFLNKTLTSMGKRMFESQIVNPVFDTNWLESEYDIIDIVLQLKGEWIPAVRSKITGIHDLEKIARQLIVQKVYPSTIYSVYKSIESIIKIASFIDVTQIKEYLSTEQNKIIETAHTIINEITRCLDIDKCSSINKITCADVNFIRPGISQSLDTVINNYNESQELLQDVYVFLNKLMRDNSKKANDDAEYINIHETEKSGSSLQITIKRADLLKQYLTKIATIDIDTNENVIVFTNNFKIPLKDIRFTKASAAKLEIDFPQFTRVTKKIQQLKEKLSQEIQTAYLEFLKNIEVNHYTGLCTLTKYIAKLDVLLTKAYIAQKYNYCRPQIDNNAEKSYFDIEGLRHVLIEHLQLNELYVTNDVQLGVKSDGILLFGTNMIGKTSLIRAIGIVIIMAQSGLYVPCSKLIYKPYTAIFSRILANDNLFRNMSTFAVEMSELRIILNMATQNSLILGDELCSGTETESALSIFTSGIQHLDRIGATYLFATHFHEIVNYDEIKQLSRLQIKHMEVRYDRENECLVYERKLKDGSGSRIYGLEVCKSLYLPSDFLEQAFQIRNKYFPDSHGYLQNKPSIYNAKKLRGICEFCGEKMGEEIHHLSPQRDASPSNIIKTEDNQFHKNHPANLTSICEKCHDQIHSNDSPENLRKQKTTKGYKITSPTK